MVGRDEGRGGGRREERATPERGRKGDRRCSPPRSFPYAERQPLHMDRRPPPARYQTPSIGSTNITSSLRLLSTLPFLPSLLADARSPPLPPPPPPPPPTPRARGESRGSVAPILGYSSADLAYDDRAELERFPRSMTNSAADSVARVFTANVVFALTMSRGGLCRLSNFPQKHMDFPLEADRWSIARETLERYLRL